MNKLTFAILGLAAGIVLADPEARRFLLFVLEKKEEGKEQVGPLPSKETVK